jgi:D-alanine-D-alanine ligase
MKVVAVFCGGVSAEHEVSIRSARNIVVAMDQNQFTPLVITISRNGTWYVLSSITDLNEFNECKDPFYYGVACTLMRQQNETFIHGPMGEDGTLQGMFEFMNLPYVGSGVLSSALGMDKAHLKTVFLNANIPVVPGICLHDKHNYLSYEQVMQQLNSNIVFVKPAIMGSSVGVSKVYSAQTYDAAIQQAFRYSPKVLVEKFIPCREIECSVLGNRNPQASCTGEIKPNHDFYSYEAKYVDPNGADLIIPANLPQDINNKIRQLALAAYIALECKGLARVDFFLSHENEIFVNEVNTLPGFTAISMYPKLWEASNIAYADLISKLLELALEQYAEKQLICLIPEVFEQTTACC